MNIYIKNRKSRWLPPKDADFPCLVLERDDWNDYSYYTTFVVNLLLGRSNNIRLGGIKLMKRGQETGIENRAFAEIESGSLLSHEMMQTEVCSLGSSSDYYDSLSTLDRKGLALEVLTALRDAASLPEIRRLFESEPCFQISLLRDPSMRKSLDKAGERFVGSTVERISHFYASLSLEGSSAPHEFSFDFNPVSNLPRRVHALVGLNGVGKTQVMAKLAMVLSRFSKRSVLSNISTLGSEGNITPLPSIYNVIAVSFSAFDEFERPTVKQGEEYSYSYCGLQKTEGGIKSKDDLLAEIRGFIASDRVTDNKRDILKRVLESLVKVDNLASFVDDPAANASLYDRLSAGQRIALNCIYHIVANISDRTMVLFDEPELHLHPQFLTGLLNAIFEILQAFDSFAIIATHSPLVVQQLPRSCVHVVRRDRMKPMILRPTFETFGENLSEITRFVFASAESDRDYQMVLNRLFEESGNDVVSVERLFESKLGLNATIYLHSLATHLDSNT